MVAKEREDRNAPGLVEHDSTPSDVPDRGGIEQPAMGDALKERPDDGVVCEVRIPTYRRPALLRRALQSLKAQTETKWRALVLDDGPGQEGRPVVAEMDDARVLYRPNRAQLRAAGNIDQAFRSRAYTAARFCCVLEDDNAFLPDFIAANVAIAQREDVQIVLRNQLVARDNGNEYSETGNTTRGHIFAEGPLDVLALRAALFFCEGISNGGLFWRADLRSDLAVGPSIRWAGLQEFARTLQIRQSVRFAAEPLAIFSLPPDSTTSTREPLSNRQFNRARQSVLQAVVSRHGEAVVEEARAMAEAAGLHGPYSQAMGDLLRPEGAFAASLRLVAKGLAKRVLVSDPMRSYLKDWLPQDRSFLY